MDFHSVTRGKMSDTFADRLRYEKATWENKDTSGGDWHLSSFLLSDDPLLICCTIVFGYILYFTLSFLFKHKLRPLESENKKLSAEMKPEILSQSKDTLRARCEKDCMDLAFSRDDSALLCDTTAANSRSELKIQTV